VVEAAPAVELPMAQRYPRSDAATRAT